MISRFRSAPALDSFRRLEESSSLAFLRLDGEGLGLAGDELPGPPPPAPPDPAAVAVAVAVGFCFGLTGDEPEIGKKLNFVCFDIFCFATRMKLQAKHSADKDLGDVDSKTIDDRN